MLTLTLVALTAAAPPSTWEPTAAEERLIQALSVRDPVPTCDDLVDRTAATQASLEALVDHVQMPPWVPMRAASCLLELHGTAAEPAFTRWVTTPEQRGLAILVFQRIDTIPVAVATRISRTALSGPFAADAENRLAKSEHASIRTLAIAAAAKSGIEVP